ncbi:MAG: FAD-dependent oxidoreductase [Gammaproteobacteria bacterium]|nr:FAD-dependent oxidoreductase [Gammaproteobacteria bacterium]MDE0442266.1 FAD-dependent oxidoreductase [Gammaproteobacteria bacterium]
MTLRSLSVDAAIVGGGISGLWLANLLDRRGLSVVVCEPNGVGGTQTVASQGIVHGGVKYGASPLASALKGMPDRWRACLEGTGEVDLTGVGVLAEKIDFHVGDETVEVDEFVLDIPSVVRRLARPIAHRVVASAVFPDSLVADGTHIERFELDPCTIHARTYLLAAGAGNEALARQAGFPGKAVEHRPLRQTIARLRRSAGVYAHWMASPTEAGPTLTVTSHDSLLSVGGRVADAGARRDEAAQIAVVKDLLRQAFPDIDVENAAFETFVADRAEPASDAIGNLPDAYVARRGNCLLCLPVKLSLAPRLGDLVTAELGDLAPGEDGWRGDSDDRVVYAPSPYTRSPC